MGRGEAHSTKDILEKTYTILPVQIVDFRQIPNGRSGDCVNSLSYVSTYGALLVYSEYCTVCATVSIEHSLYNNMYSYVVLN